MGYIQHQQNRVWARQAVHLTGQHLDGNAFIVGIRRQAVHTRQIDDPDLVSAARQYAHALLDRHAWVIADLLTQAGETIEERRLPRIGWADQGHRPDFTARELRNFFTDGEQGLGRSIATTSAIQNRRHGKSPKGVAPPRLTMMWHAVSARRAISVPAAEYTLWWPKGARRENPTCTPGTKPTRIRNCCSAGGREIWSIVAASPTSRSVSATRSSGISGPTRFRSPFEPAQPALPARRRRIFADCCGRSFVRYVRAMPAMSAASTLSRSVMMNAWSMERSVAF